MLPIITNLAHLDATALPVYAARALQVMTGAFRNWKRRRRSRAVTQTEPHTTATEPETFNTGELK